METKKTDKSQTKEVKEVEEVKEVKEVKDIKEIKEGAPFAALSYIFVLWILTFIHKKDNRFAYFHARQGMILFFTKLICFSLSFLPFVGGLFRLVTFALFLVSLYGIYISLKGKCEKIYIIDSIANKFII